MNKLFSLSFFLILLLSSYATVAQDANHWESIIKTGDSVKYILPVSEPAENWNSVEFDDGLWINGISGIGYGDGDDNTEISSTLSVYIRYRFEISSLSSIVQLILDFDD